MKILSFDWATKRALTIFDPGPGKTKQISNSIGAFNKFLATLKDPAIMLFEFGGGDTFKIMAYRAGHIVLQIPGKKIKDYRDSKGLKKGDLIDAKLIYDFFIENGGEAAESVMRNFRTVLRLSSSKNTERGSVKSCVRNSRNRLPSPFYLFKESNAEIAEIKILFRAHEDLKKAMVREKNKLFAFNIQFKIARIPDDRIAKIRIQKKASIAAKEKELKALKEILEKKLEGFQIWTHYRQIKGIGPMIVAGLMGELGGRQFEDDGSLKHYSGMVAKPDHHDFNRYVKAILYQFAEQAIKRRIPGWRKIYDSMKIYYAKKHADWKPGKVDAYAKKFIETKFLIDFWHKWGGRAAITALRNSKH